MSGSEQHNQVALVSVDDQARLGGIVNSNLLEMDFREREAMLEEAHAVLRQVAQYTEPTSTVQQVCDHPSQIIALQKEMTDLKSHQFLPPHCDHTESENQIKALTA
jgi:hypothetical protein